MLAEALAAVQVLRLPLLWGPSSVVAPSYVTSWTSQGWLCRVYLTLNMGVLVPFFCWWILFLLLAAKRKVERSVEVDAEIYTEQKAKIGRMIRKRLADAVLGKSEVILPSLLSSVPIFALQTVTAWIGLAFSYNGNNIEYSPRSVLGYFLGTFWYGTQEQCSTSTVSDYTTCTLCVIPATSVIIHGIWTLLYLALLWHVSLSLGRLVMNRHMRRILVLHACALTLILSAGVACLGSSIAYDPFGWINQGLWLGYFLSIVLMCFITCALWILRPVHEMRLALKSTDKEEYFDPGWSQDDAMISSEDPSPPNKTVEDTPARDVLLRPDEYERLSRTVSDHSMENTPRSTPSYGGVPRNLMHSFSQAHTPSPYSTRRSEGSESSLFSSFQPPYYQHHRRNSSRQSNISGSQVGKTVEESSSPKETST
eukprot:jgi/Picsp_1/1628/NSC_05104-R3_hypothetical protein CHLNCDRAFT_140060 [Chlorella variabilis]